MYHREYACAKNVIGEIRVNGVVVDKIKAEIADPLEEYCCNICQKPFPDPNDPGMRIKIILWIIKSYFHENVIIRTQEKLTKFNQNKFIIRVSIEYYLITWVGYLWQTLNFSQMGRYSRL